MIGAGSGGPQSRGDEPDRVERPAEDAEPSRANVGSLSGKVALVTGGASGIGRASALRLSADGASVIVADIDPVGGRRTVEEARRGGHAVTFVRCDVSEPAEVRDLFDEARATFDGVDILHLNAAHMSDFHSVTETSEADWTRAIAVTLGGAFLCAKYGLPMMIERGGGSVIATTSVGGSLAFERMAAYCAAKGGLAMLVRSIALDYGRLGIRANAVAPGRVQPEGAVASEDARYSLLQRPWATTAEIAAAVSYLASDDAAFITGIELTVDGGWSAHWARNPIGEG